MDYIRRCLVIIITKEYFIEIILSGQNTTLHYFLFIDISKHMAIKSFLAYFYKDSVNNIMAHSQSGCSFGLPLNAKHAIHSHGPRPLMVTHFCETPSDFCFSFVYQSDLRKVTSIFKPNFLLM